MRLKLIIPPALFFALACTGGSSSDSDSGEPDTSSADSDTDADTDTDPVESLTELTDPCGGSGTPYALTFLDADNGYVGCGSGLGLWKTDDGGQNFTRGHPSNDLYVYEVAEDNAGRLLVCGHDYDTTSDGGMLFRLDSGSWSTLLSYGNNNTDPAAVYMSNCGAMATSGSERLMVASLTAGDITWSENDGLTWVKEERYWEDANLDSGGYSYYYMLSMTSLSDGSIYGGGSQISEPPVIFSPTLHSQGDWTNFHASIVDNSIIGEVQSMATHDDGMTWLVGGRDQDATTEASGFIYRSTDSGESWTSISLPDGVDVVHDIEMDGNRGIAVGHRYPTTQGGFILLTEDAGLTWTEVKADPAILQSAAIVGDTWWAAGDAWLGTGQF